MKRITASLFAIALSVAPFTPAAKAQTDLSAFNLATLAYRGQFIENGIPSYAALEASLASGILTPEDVIQAAIAAGRLPEDTLQNREFVTNVRYQLQNLVEHN